jgi:hypothetical protein
MRRLVLPMQVSVDGVVAGPNGDSTGSSGLGGREVTMVRGMSTVNL